MRCEVIVRRKMPAAPCTSGYPTCGGRFGSAVPSGTPDWSPRPGGPAESEYVWWVWSIIRQPVQTVRARELHQDGWNVSAISRDVGHDRKTVRIYLSGQRRPGQQRSDTTDLFAALAAYTIRRQREDPHVSASALHHELTSLHYNGSYSALTRSLRQRDLMIPRCPACQQSARSQITNRAFLLNDLHTHQELPVRIRPIFGQTIASYLDQVATANHLPATTLLAHLPPWFARRYLAHDDLAANTRSGVADSHALARLTGNTENALRATLPALTWRTREQSAPMRLTTACRRCTSHNHITTSVPTHLPALQRLCPRHRIWLGQTQQIDTTNCPEIAGAARRATRLQHRHSPQQILLVETTSREIIITHWLREDRHPSLTRRWSTRASHLNPSSSPQAPTMNDDVITAVTYPETITLTAAILSSPTTPTEHLGDQLSPLLPGSP